MKLSEVKPVSLDWVWEGRLARGMFTLLEGDPGVGKGLVSIDIAARLTRGWPLPGEIGYQFPIEERIAVRDPIDVLLISTEDSRVRTVAPRARAAGADLNRIISMVGIRSAGRSLQAMTEALINLMREEMRGSNVRYIHMDPIEDVIPGFTTCDSVSIREAITTLNDFARSKDLAYCGARHLSKFGRGRAVNRGRGSISLTAAARMVYLIAPDPDDPDIRIMACVKNNLSETPPSLAFRIVSSPSPTSPHSSHSSHSSHSPDSSSPHLQWLGPVDHSADHLVNPRTESAVGKAEIFLLETLANGPVPISLAMEKALNAGISDPSLWRAKVRLKIKSVRTGFGGGGYWSWRLPD